MNNKEGKSFLKEMDRIDAEFTLKKKYKIVKKHRETKQVFKCRIGQDREVLLGLAKYWNGLKGDFTYSVRLDK